MTKRIRTTKKKQRTPFSQTRKARLAINKVKKNMTIKSPHRKKIVDDFNISDLLSDTNDLF